VSVAWERVRAVCFDMDGTLVDSDALWLRATRAAFDRFGLPLQAAIGSVPVRPAQLGPAGPLLGAAHLTFRA